MQFTENGYYELVTNGVQVIPVTVAVTEQKPVLDSVAGVKITQDVVQTATSGVETVIAAGKGIFYNTIDAVDKFTLALNQTNLPRDFSGVYKYIVFDLQDDIDYYINVVQDTVDKVLTIVDNVKSVIGVLSYVYDFALMGIEIAAFLL